MWSRCNGKSGSHDNQYDLWGRKWTKWLVGTQSKSHSCSFRLQTVIGSECVSLHFTAAVSFVFCPVAVPIWQEAPSEFPLHFRWLCNGRGKEYYSSVFEVVYWKLQRWSAAVAAQRMKRSVLGVRWNFFSCSVFVVLKARDLHRNTASMNHTARLKQRGECHSS